MKPRNPSTSAPPIPTPTPMPILPESDTPDEGLGLAVIGPEVAVVFITELVVLLIALLVVTVAELVALLGVGTGCCESSASPLVQFTKPLTMKELLRLLMGPQSKFLFVEVTVRAPAMLVRKGKEMLQGC